MPGSRKCPKNCRCGKHQNGGSFKSWARGAARKVGSAAQAVWNNPDAKKIISQVARTAVKALPHAGAQSLANMGLSQVGLGRRRMRGTGYPSLRAGGGRRRR